VRRKQKLFYLKQSKTLNKCEGISPKIQKLLPIQNFWSGFTLLVNRVSLLEKTTLKMFSFHHHRSKAELAYV
jgi:hypothetical protein